MNTIDYRKNHKYLNCSETMLYFANDYYKLNLNPIALKAMSGFGGGLFEEDLCGLVSGGVSVISMILTQQTAYQSPDLNKAVIAYKKRIKDAFGSIDCRLIKPNHRDELNGCDQIIIKAMNILIQVIDDFKVS
ncbi:MAG: C-GCAxxG-C-C family protein [Candidatus Izemoplasmatales bacterium]